MRRIYFIFSLLLAVALGFSSCEDPKYIADPISDLNSRVFKRTLEQPNIVGEEIEFTYAMAIPKDLGTLKSMSVTASIAGDVNTYIDPNSYNMTTGGVAGKVEVAAASTNSGAVTSTTFTMDTIAATLRYYYEIPEAARGKEVSFTFTCTASNGKTHSQQLGPYKVEKMDIVTGITLKDNDACFLSIEDMKAYKESEITDASKIDLVYFYRAPSGVSFAHALYSPSAVAGDAVIGTSFTMPAGVNNQTWTRRTFELRDRQLRYNNPQYSEWVTDYDLEQIVIADYNLIQTRLVADNGMWVETHDGKYKAFVFINTINNSDKSMVVSFKRLQVK